MWNHAKIKRIMMSPFGLAWNGTVKGLAHPKMKIKSLITHPHDVLSRKTFIQLRNTNEDIFDSI